MDLDPDESVRFLRTELYELLDDLKELKFSSVDEFSRFQGTTRDDRAPAQIQIQTLRRQKDSMSNLKTRLIEKFKTSSCTPSLMGSAHSPGGIPSSSPAPQPSAPQQGPGFPYEVSIPLTELFLGGTYLYEQCLYQMANFCTMALSKAGTAEYRKGTNNIRPGNVFSRNR